MTYQDAVAVISSFESVYEHVQGEDDVIISLTPTYAGSLLFPDQREKLEEVLSAIVAQKYVKLIVDADGIHLVSDNSADGFSPRMELPISCWKDLYEADVVVTTAAGALTNEQLMELETSNIRLYWTTWVHRYWTIWDPNVNPDIDWDAFEPHQNSYSIWQDAFFRAQENPIRRRILRQFFRLLRELWREEPRGVTVYLQSRPFATVAFNHYDPEIARAIFRSRLWRDSIDAGIVNTGDYADL